VTVLVGVAVGMSALDTAQEEPIGQAGLAGRGAARVRAMAALRRLRRPGEWRRVCGWPSYPP